MAGSGLSVITQQNTGSYNAAVNTINKHQRENVQKLESALVMATSNNDKLLSALQKVQRNIDNLKKQVFINQCLVDNWYLSAPYRFPIDLLT